MRLHRGPGREGTALLVLHDAGSWGAGRDWQALLDRWPGPSVAPDLPGHGASPPPEGAKYIPADATLAALEVLEDTGLGLPPPVVLGHGWGAYAAELLACGGRACALVLVDGLGGPWVTEEEIALDQARWLRGVLEDGEATRWPGRLPDPLLAHGFPSVWERDFTTARRAAITVPVLAVETPRSITAASERGDRLAAFTGPGRLVELATAPVQEAVEEVAAVVLGWLEGLREVQAEG